MFLGLQLSGLLFITVFNFEVCDDQNADVSNSPSLDILITWDFWSLSSWVLNRVLLLDPLTLFYAHTRVYVCVGVRACA